MIWPIRSDFVDGMMLSNGIRLNVVPTMSLTSWRLSQLRRCGSPWFDGHFPGQPILPGIAMIAMAFDAAREKEAREGNRIRLKAVKRVRFKKPVRPDEPFTLALKREQKESGISLQFHDSAGRRGSLHRHTYMSSGLPNNVEIRPLFD